MIAMAEARQLRGKAQHIRRPRSRWDSEDFPERFCLERVVVSPGGTGLPKARIFWERRPVIMVAVECALLSIRGGVSYNCERNIF
jgi:hypothetical protein